MACLALACVGAASLSPETSNAVTAAVRATVLRPFLELHQAVDGRVGRPVQVVRAERDSLARLLAVSRSLDVPVRAADGGLLAGALRVADPVAGDSVAVDPVAGALSQVAVSPDEFLVGAVRPGRTRLGRARRFTMTGVPAEVIEFPAAVVTAHGVLGVARANSGIGITGDYWSHPDFRVSVASDPGGFVGIVRSDVGPERDRLLLETAPFGESVPEDALLVTTGVSGVYPRGVPVGWVRSGPADGAFGTARLYQVEPVVSPGESYTAMIWAPRPPTGAGDESGAGGQTPGDSS